MMSSLKLKQAWLAIRPKTLTLALAPLLVATALAWSETAHLQWALIVAIAISALCLQIGTNLYNDAVDFERGTDTANRIGFARAGAEGWFSANQLKKSALFFFIFFWLPASYLIWVGGWLTVLAGVLSIMAGYGYTGGSRPIAYTPLGELTVFVFFGVIATVGFYYLQTLHFSVSAFCLGSALGFFASAVLLVNNYRDVDTDKQANRVTLAIYLGRPRSRWLYAGLLLVPFLSPFLLPTLTVLVWLSLPWAVFLIRRIFIEPIGANLNDLLSSTAKLQSVYGLLMSAGLIFSG